MKKGLLLTLALVVSLDAKGAEVTGVVEDNPHLGAYILTDGTRGIHIYFTMDVDGFSYGVVAWDSVAIECFPMIIKGNTITVTSNDISEPHQHATKCEEGEHEV